MRAYTGEVKIISNSSFQEVINYNLNHSRIVINIPVSYDTNIDKLESTLRKIKEGIEKDKNVYSMNLLGIDKFSDSAIEYAIVLECVPMTHYGIKRKALADIKKLFDEENIVIPYNKLDVHIDK